MPAKPKRARVPPKEMSHPDLLQVFLPHRAMLHKTVGPSEMSLKDHSKLDSDLNYPLPEPSFMGQIFPLGYEEIAGKKWLRIDVENVVAGIIKQVNKLPPFQFLLRFASLHSIEAAWKKDEAMGSGPVPSYDAAPATNHANSGSNRPGQAPPSSDPNRTLTFNPLRKKIVVPNLVEKEKQKLKPLLDYLRTDSPKMEMEKLATDVGSVFAYVNGYFAVVLDKCTVFGSNFNENIFAKYLRLYLQAGIGDKLPVGCVVREMDLTAIPWLIRVSQENRDLILAEFLMWIFGDIVNPLVNRHFYVTSTQFLNNERLYFRREIWKLLCQKTVNEYEKQGLWRPLKNKCENGRLSEVQDFLTVSRTMQSVYQTRFVPRENGVRPIMVPMATAGHDINRFDRRERLVHTRLVLNYIMDLFNKHGLGVRSTAVIQQRWAEFRKRRLESGDRRPLFFVSTDIQKAYDTVDLPILRKIIEQLYQKCKARDLYFFFIYDRCPKTLKDEDKPPRLPPGTPRYEVISKEDYQLKIDGVRNEELGEPKCVDLNNIFADIGYMSTPAVFRVDRKYYTFLRGIPQGCSLSRNLLDYYYSALEDHLGMTALPDELLMRFVDDLIFITPLPSRAKIVHERFSAGLPEIGLMPNQEKTVHNLAKLKTGDVVQHNEKAPLLFYGWSIDLVHLALSIDMRRYYPFRIRYCCCVNYADECTFANSIIATIGGKFSCPLFDIACNPKPAIIRNLYECFLLTAIHFRAYWRHAPVAVRRAKNVIRLIAVVVKSLVRRITSRWNGDAIPVMGSAQVWTLAWQAMAIGLCVEDERWSPLKKGCRTRIISRARTSMEKMAVDGDAKWTDAFLKVPEIRYPHDFKILDSADME